MRSNNIYKPMKNAELVIESSSKSILQGNGEWKEAQAAAHKTFQFLDALRHNQVPSTTPCISMVCMVNKIDITDADVLSGTLSVQPTRSELFLVASIQPAHKHKQDVKFVFNKRGDITSTVYQ